MARTDENQMDFYKKALEEVVSPNTNNDFDKYISALSLYLSSGSSDYKYNVTYLRREHEKFRKFIELSDEKIKKIILIKDVLKDIFIREKLGLDSAFLLVDDFWIIGLNESVPDIYEEYHFDSAKTPTQYSLVSLYCKNDMDKKITFNLTDYNKIDFKNSLENLLEKVWK